MSLKLPKITLVRGAASCTLHGTVHVGTAKMFAYLKDGVDEITHLGGIFFCEGIDNGPELDPPPTDEEYEIADVVAFILGQPAAIADKYELLNEAVTLELDRAKAIIADATFPQLVRKLYEVGWHRTFHYRITKQEMTEEKEPRCTNAASPDDAWEKLPFFSKLSANLFGFAYDLFCARKFDRVFVDWRSEIAVQIFEETMSTRCAPKALIHYGCSHIAGIKKRLVRRGWSVIKTETLVF